LPVEPGPPLPPPAPPIFVPPAQLPPGAFWVDGHFYTSVQVDAVQPSVSHHLQAYVPLNDGATALLTVPNQGLGWTISPRIDIGLRLPSNGSEVAFGYRFLIADGTGTTATTAGPASLKSQLDINQFDLYYGSGLGKLAPDLTLKWRAGMRVALAYYETQATSIALAQKASTYFVGAGPEGGIELTQHLPFLPDLSLFARADGAVLVGELKQSYTQFAPLTPNYPLDGGLTARGTQSVPVAAVQGGLNYVVPGTTLKFTLGYTLEQWWSLGRLNSARLDLTNQSVFLRGEVEF
jgi:hypothetical protein